MAACGPSGIEQPRDSQVSDDIATSASAVNLWEQIEEIQEEMRSRSGPIARARILAPAQARLASFPDDGIDGGGFYSAQARLVDDTSEITVYVPHGVELARDDLIDITVGEYGYYFDSFVETR